MKPSVGYLVTINPADGWGAPWYELYRTKDHAGNRVRDFAERYELDLGHDSEGLRASNYALEFDMNHRIAEVFITCLYYDD